MRKMIVFHFRCLGIFSLVVLIAGFQNCSAPKLFTAASTTEISSEQSVDSGNGGTYDGKLTILHHYEDGFMCEGRRQPESILIAVNLTNWTIIQNDPAKCARIDQARVTGVQYNPMTKQAIYKDKTYVPPRPYLVDALENPNLPDVKTIDGVCEDSNGKCSLLAAIQQSGLTSGTAPVTVEIPPGNFLLTSTMLLQTAPGAFPVQLRGATSASSVIDGGNSTNQLMVRGYNSIVSIENLTFQNGFNTTSFGASAIVPAMQGGTTEILNCVFKNNQGNAAINGGSATGAIGNVIIRKSKFLSNQNGVKASGLSGLLIEDTTMSGNLVDGLNIFNNTPNVIIRNSTFDQNSRGIVLNNCGNCRIENSTITNNSNSGLSVSVSMSSPSYDLQILNSTIYQNGLAGTGYNIVAIAVSNTLTLINSIVAQSGVGFSNCRGSNTANIIASHSIFDDVSCAASGNDNLITDPQLAPLAMSGGLTATLSPLAASPATDGGNNLTCLPTDQRGFNRPEPTGLAAATCDIGAVESQ